jgi:hypothetical protein
VSRKLHRYVGRPHERQPAQSILETPQPYPPVAKRCVIRSRAESRWLCGGLFGPTQPDGVSQQLNPTLPQKEHLWSCVSMLVIIASTGSGVVAQPTKPLRRVLVLYSDARLLPVNLIADEAIRATFAAESKGPHRIFTASFWTFLDFLAKRSSSVNGISWARSILSGHPTW